MTEERKGKRLISKINAALKKSRDALSAPISNVIGRADSDEPAWEDLEEALIKADVGVATAIAAVAAARREAGRNTGDPAAVKNALKREIVAVLAKAGDPPMIMGPEDTLTVLILAGVNGAGKTTTAGKIAGMAAGKGRKAVLAASDTFRAAAIEQAERWAERAGAHIVKHKRGGDAAAVAFDAIQAAKARGAGIAIIDTAGRLHTKAPLMDELRKIKSVSQKEAPGSRVVTLLVIDATTGQNGLAQAKSFGADIGLDGIVLTKLDGTAKGGIVVAIARELSLPVVFVGTGEAISDIAEFSASGFAEGLIS